MNLNANDQDIVIVGGGISGLTLLHYLNQKFAGKAKPRILLIEKKSILGGTASTETKNACLFERGPNGFLNNKKETLEFCAELGLSEQLIQAQDTAHDRYIVFNNSLQRLPGGPKDFFANKLLSFSQKLNVLRGLFDSARSHDHESIHDFVSRKMGSRFADVFVDAMVAGIYGGDVRKLNFAQAFPKVYSLVQQHGSLFNILREMKKTAPLKDKTVKKRRQSTMTAFPLGMSQLFDNLQNKYSSQIKTDCAVEELRKVSDGYQLVSEKGNSYAKKIFLAVPAPTASRILQKFDSDLSGLLASIPYAPVAVVGLLYKQDQVKDSKSGYGYLFPSYEQKGVLGVLFEHNIFSGRCPEGYCFFRVILGGVFNPELVNKDDAQLIELARQELHVRLAVHGEPQDIFVARWRQGIPQYNDQYAQIKPKIIAALEKFPNLKLAANYWGGVAFNDCIANAKQLALETT